MIVQESDNEFDELDEMDEFDELEESDEFDELEESDEFDELEESDEFDELEESDEFDELDENTIDEVFNEIFNQDSEEMDEMVGVDYLNPEDGENSETLYELYLDDEESEEMEEDLYESKSFKAKGKGFGSPNKFKYSSKPNQEGGFKTKQKEGPKSIGTGKAKFTYKDGENLDGEFKIKPKKKVEANEASRTLGSGKRWGREGLDKPKAAPRHLRKESVDSEVKLLREKNEEYRNALNVFRDKLNEVAVFNSNLAYATRLFTEHTTTKQEKIYILQRFDSVETIKESKSLYQTIKQELNKDNSSKPNNESVEKTFDNTPSTGSAINLIESKTYENPQFLRMKDLMGKLK